VILLDTTPLVALCDRRDGLNRRSLRDLDASREPLVLCLPVLTEACLLLPHRPRRARLRRVLAEFSVAAYQSDDAPRLWLDGLRGPWARSGFGEAESIGGCGAERGAAA